MPAPLQPLVSVVVPCYNHGQYLAQTIESIHTGSYANYEILIVDDGSADPHTHQVLALLAQHPKVKVLRQPNGGPAQARNTGIAQAEGEFLFFVDADNWAKPTYIEQGVAVLQANPAVGVVYADALLVGERDKRWATATDGNVWKSQEFDLKKLYEGNFIDNCTVVRKDALAQVGGYEPDRTIQGWEDWELWLRMAKAGWQFHYLGQPLFYYRTLPGSVISLASGCEKRMSKLDFILHKHPHLLSVHYQNLARNYCKLVKTANDYETLANSREYKLGRAVLAPLLQLKKWLTRP
jgi:glycosyltransferase involved in cell wall biosynthesis